MITKEQYLAAKEIVSQFENQEYAERLEQVKKEFPIGSKARGQNGWTYGEVFGYGRAGNDVTLRVRQGGRFSAGHFLAKYAEKYQ